MGKRNAASLIADVNRGGMHFHQEHTELPVNGPPPNVSTPYRERSDGSLYVDVFVAHLTELASRQTESGRSRFERKLARTFIRVVNITINHDPGILTESE